MSKIKQGYKQTKVGIIPEDWEVVKLSEIFSKSFYGTSDSTNEIGKYPVLRMGNMQNGTLDLKDLVYLDLVEKEFKKYQLKKGDILLNRTNSYELVGKISLFDLDGDYLSASYIVAYRPNFKVLNSIFINNLLNTTYFQNKIRTIATKGVSQANINPTSFKEVINIPLPPLKEQEKIAEILTTWDEAISKQTELLRAKELLKIALMQKLLSGEVRFSGFSDEWEEVRLGEICKITTGKLNANAMVENGQYTFFTCARETYKINEFAFDTEALLVSGNGANVGYIHYFKGKFNAYQRTYVLDDFEHDIFLIKYLLDKYLSLQISREKNEGNTPYITLPTLTKMKLKLPSLPEQQKIAEVLSLADDEINLLKNELEELKLQKKALMQKLLTGEVRVKV
ncbi:restriction endonuclease subunit S [Aliarcobacter cryaerophilus]|uniref:restriction endonuclease subunit S n=1 Tax=Aliarcobacter cryaerophilus TaxID=28198 RepID=UPI0008357A51|nr:restriction endonuclease subunit S [Aliarcobacter cryaerophilus]